MLVLLPWLRLRLTFHDPVPVTVCGASLLLVHVTLVPAVITIFFGLNRYCPLASVVTTFFTAWAVLACAECPGHPAAIATPTRRSDAKARLVSRFIAIFLSNRADRRTKLFH